MRPGPSTEGLGDDARGGRSGESRGSLASPEAMTGARGRVRPVWSRSHGGQPGWSAKEQSPAATVGRRLLGRRIDAPGPGEKLAAADHLGAPGSHHRLPGAAHSPATVGPIHRGSSAGRPSRWHRPRLLRRIPAFFRSPHCPFASTVEGVARGTRVGGTHRGRADRPPPMDGRYGVLGADRRSTQVRSLSVVRRRQSGRSRDGRGAGFRGATRADGHGHRCASALVPARSPSRMGLCQC